MTNIYINVWIVTLEKFWVLFTLFNIYIYIKAALREKTN